MNPVERAIAAISPTWAARRARARMQVHALHAAYEAAHPSRLRDRPRDYGSGNAVVSSSALHVRNMARHLGRNHDIVVNGLNTLVQNIVGPQGIGIEPQPRDANGDIVESVVDQLTMLFRDWCRCPEVTRAHDYASMQRLKGLTLFRDGEVFHQDLVGPVPYLDHGTRVPYSIELIEPDLVPLDLDDPNRNIIAGVECNAWGRPVAYHVYRQHPGDPGVFTTQTKRVSADMIRHAKMIDRIGQRRGVSLLASVLTRLDDIKDYEESERVAAKIAACMAAAIIKGDPQSYDHASYGCDTSGEALPERRMRFEPGMIFDNLRPGEQVQSIDSKRPNPNVETYRNGQLRAVSGGMRVSFSSLAKDYNGTYSAQRQELVEQYGAYGILAYELIAQDVRPMWERFVATAVLSGELVVPRGMPMRGIADALYLPVQMPWIDPKKEAEGLEIMERNTYMSGPEIIRRRGASPRDVLDQQSAWIERKREWGIASNPVASTEEPEEE